MSQQHYRAIVAKRGRLTIPAAFRKRLGLKPGQKVSQWVENGKIVLEFDTIDEVAKPTKNLIKKD